MRFPTDDVLCRRANLSPLRRVDQVPSPGRAAELNARSAAVEDLTEALSCWAREHRELPWPSPARLAVLVDLHDVEASRASLAAWADGHPGIRLDVTGPWPPFSFCEDAP